MLERGTCLLVVFLLGACDSTVVGGGLGGGGRSGTTSGEGTSGSGGSGGAPTSLLGTCTSETGSGSTGSNGACLDVYACTAGNVRVVCGDDGDLPFCDCFLDDVLRGSCEGSAECALDASCCGPLLDGRTSPTPRQFGSCTPGDSTGASGSGGVVSCAIYHQCEGGRLDIECVSNAGEDATCTCRDGVGTVLATCEQPTADCSWEGSCCQEAVEG